MSIYQPPASCQIPGLAQIYEEHFGSRTHGSFVEVGAFDGESYSNTSFLADLGWQGIYIEPVFWEQCMWRHRKNAVHVYRVACGAAAGQVVMCVAGALSSHVGEAFAAHLANPGSVQYIKGQERRVQTVEVVTLDGVLEDHGTVGNPDLLVVDVEGAEPEVFAGFDLEKWRPRMMIVELHADNPEFVALAHAMNTLRSRIISAGYTVRYEDQINTIFVRNQ